MAFEMQSQLDILQRTKADYKEKAADAKIANISGTFTGDLLSASAVEFEKAYAEMSLIMEAAFADTAWGEYLTMRAAESGIIRKQAVKAIGQVSVKGTGTVTKGSRFATEDGILFEAVETTVIAGSGLVDIQAVDAGAKGNVEAGQINTIPMTIAGISSCINEEDTHDGYDTETDAALLERYLIHVRTPGTSGNKYHYLEWATSVEGVGAAKVIPTWDGPGTVKVIIVDQNFESASETLTQKVRDYIESVRPIGAVVTVVTAIPKTIDISVKIVGNIRGTDFAKYCKQYFVDLEKKSISEDAAYYVALSQIGSLLLNAGAEDYSGLTLNGKAENIPLAAEEIATFGEVTIT